MGTSPPPPLKTPPPLTSAFAHQAAKGSWASALIVFLLLAFGVQSGARVILELVALLLNIVGLALGIVALFGIRKHGSKGILAPAVVGIIINGLLLFIFVTNFVTARARAQKMKSEVWPNQPVQRTGASRFAQSEMRTPSAAGSRR